MIGAPTVWNTPDRYRGEGIKVAVIDTGIDYTHADFGGPGTTAAYETAHAAETAPADKSCSGRRRPRSRAASTWSATATTPTRTATDYQPVPHPDSNPLDCNGHGSHVGGTIAGFGVLGQR
jgi:subtilisin family serine protease